MPITNWNSRQLAVAAALVAVVGCERGDTRLETLTVGMPKDSVIAAMGGPPKRVDPYLFQGKYIEAMYFPKQGKTDSASLADRSMSPLVLIDGKLLGWGWPFWDSVAVANTIPVAKQ